MHTITFQSQDLKKFLPAAGVAVVGTTLISQPANAQAVDPVAEVTDAVTGVTTAVQAAIPVAITVFAFGVLAYCVKRVMFSA